MAEDGERNKDVSENKVTLANSEGKPLIPEITEALKQDKGQVDINVLLRVIVEKSHDPEHILQYSKQLLQVAEQYEVHRLNAFQQRAEVIIDIKNRDPDEIEKRQNNKVRRGLKITVGICSVVGCVGTVASAVMGASIVATGILATIGGIALAMMTPLASGESVSSNDTVRILAAVKDVFNTRGGEGKNASSSRRKRAHK